MTQASLLARVRGKAKRELKRELKRGSSALNHRLTTDQERTQAAIEDFRKVPTDLARADVIDRFHQIYYNDGPERGETWRRTTWLGTTIWKCPLDLWLYQEIIHRIRPDLIIETGTAFGGSAHYLGTLCDVVGNGQVVSVDIAPQPDLPAHPRVRYITASSVDPAIVHELGELARSVKTVMVILDSDHSEAHVGAELAVYSPLVTVDSYLVVEDTNVNGHPAWADFGPGPMEAANAFLATHPEFVRDPDGEKFLLTFNPRGLLKRVS
jgi:cephalosporin hydroxylase